MVKITSESWAKKDDPLFRNGFTISSTSEKNEFKSVLLMRRKASEKKKRLKTK